MSVPNELAKAKLQVMAAVPYVQKRKAQGLNYSFAGEAAIIEKLHPAMVSAGLSFAPTACAVVFQEAYTTKNGAAMNRVIVQATYTLTHAASGQSETLQTLGEGSDSGDKATSKALTGALKYALRHAFLLETGDDPDETPSEVQQRAAPQGRPASAPAPAAEAAPTAELIDSLLAGLAVARGASHADTLASFLASYGPDVPALADLPRSSWPVAVKRIRKATAEAHAQPTPKGAK